MRATTSPYVELRCRSAFSFLAAASLPEDLVARARELGYTALALTDIGGVSGAPRFHKAAGRAGIRAIIGAEATIEGHPLLLLCESQAGYRSLCRLITASKMRGPRAGLGWDELEVHAAGLHALTGGGEGRIGAALDRGDGAGAADALDRLLSIFGAEHLAVELQVHMEEAEDRRNAALVPLARRHRLPLVLTNDVRLANPDRADLLDVLTCVRQGITVDEAGTRLLRNAERHLKSPAAMAALLPDLPEAVENTQLVAKRCGFTLDKRGYRFPDYPLPTGETPSGYLRHLVWEAAPERFHPFTPQARTQIERELHLICKLGLEGYFLIVWELIQFCKKRGILVQGRGSAANSAVCYALGITACDPVKHELLFERFLSEQRGEWPDIDLDLPAGDRREEVIQHVYAKYGRHGAAMTANVISYRGRSAIRDVGKALGFLPGQLAKLAALLSQWGDGEMTETLAQGAREAGLDPREPRVRQLVRLCGEIQDLPRHLSQHPGGMVIAAGRLDEVVPLQPATMPGRVIVQWDKDDCADMGIIKIDLLGLGMMRALEEAVRLCPQHDGVKFDIAALPEDDRSTYEMIQRADTVGLFQIESRAQMAVLPKMKPSCFYDLVVQIALIRPGPITGDLMHPYLRRRAETEDITYPHPSLEPILERTLGVPLFQEQLLRISMVAAGFSGGEAEELRRAMTHKRSEARMASLREQIVRGMEHRGITGKAAEEILRVILSFAAYGFPESHAISFAILAYASAYLRVHHPAVFYTSLCNAQPMGFYHPSSLVQDAKRHGVRVLPVDVTRSAWSCTIEGEGRPSRTFRLGLRYVRVLRRQAGEALLAARAQAPFSSLGDLRHRCPQLRAEELATLAEIGAFATLEGHPSRRSALWQVSAFETSGPLFDGAQDPADVSPLEDMDLGERTRADYHGTGLTVGPHPIALWREGLRRAGAVKTAELAAQRAGAWVKVAGVVTTRQRPETAKGYVFITLEDEAGRVDVIVTPRVFAAHRALLVTAPVLIVEGPLQNEDGVINVKGRRFATLDQAIPAPPSHDFH